MTLAFVLSLAFLARQAPAPSLPAGVAPEFAKAALAVEARLVEGDVAGAREAAKALPVRSPRIVWADDALLPAELRASREKGLALIAKRWAYAAPNFAPKVASDSPDVTIGFAATLPDGPDGLPLETKVDFGPPYRTTINLTRGKPDVPIRPEDLNVEIAYSLGRYLGVPENPFPGSAMYRDGRSGLVPTLPAADEAALASRNLDFADRLRASVAAGKPLGLALPTVRLSKETLDLGTVDQGAPLRTTIEVENLGAGALDYAVKPDCSCFSPIPAGQVAPQGRGRFRLTINTEEYVGRQDKRVLFRSNDPTRPTIEIPVTFRTRPAYRLFRPGGDKVTVPAAGGTYDYFLFTPPGSKLHVVSYDWNGMAAKVSWEPWSGPLADPEMHEGALPRTGWRFHVRVPAKLAEGRTLGTLTIETDSPVFHTLMATLYVQKGIVADDVNLGDIASGTQASLIVDRPNAPFKILGVDAGVLKATWTDRRGGWEYRIDLEYKGGAQKGDLLVPVRIRTNDPKQPVVEALARGFVK